MHTSEVAEGIHWLEHAHVNVYFVEQDGRVMIIDAGLPGSRPHIRAALRTLGYEDSVVALVLTHGHFDHVGSAAWLRNTYRVPILVHPDDAWIAAHPYSYKHELNRVLVPLRHPASLPIIGRMKMAGALFVRGVTDTSRWRPGPRGTCQEPPRYCTSRATPTGTSPCISRTGACSLSETHW